MVAGRRIARAPVAEVVRRHPRKIVLTALCRMGEQAPFYIFTAFVFAYDVDTLRLNRNSLVAAVLATSALSFVSIPLFGHLSDWVGRKKIYMLGAALTGVLRFRVFRSARHAAAVPRVPRDRRVADSARRDVRPAGAADCRMFSGASALQRRVARVSVVVGDRRWSRAVDCHVAAQHVSLWLRNRRFHSSQPDRDAPGHGRIAGSH